jgi:hypothetical protein
VAIAVPVVGWLMKDRSALRSQVTELRVEIARDYVRHEHLSDIKSALIRIEAMLYNKADKE